MAISKARHGPTQGPAAHAHCLLVVRLDLYQGLPILDPRYRYGKMQLYDWLQFPREAKGASIKREMSAKEERPRIATYRRRPGTAPKHPSTVDCHE